MWRRDCICECSSRKLNGVSQPAHLPFESYLRLGIPNMFPELKKVIYLNGDILVRDDLSELWNMDLEGCPLAACDDISALKHMDRLKISSYHNTGVMVFDLTLWRKEDLQSDIFALIEKEGHNYVFGDQDAINVALEGRIKLMDLCWNLFSILFNHSLSPSFSSGFDYIKGIANPAIIHFAGKFKPFFLEKWLEVECVIPVYSNEKWLFMESYQKWIHDESSIWVLEVVDVF